MMRILVIAAVLLAGPVLAKGAVAVPASALVIEQVSPAIDWRWRVAPEVGGQPALLRAMRAEALAEAARARAGAARDAAAAKTAGVPFRQYDSVADWSRAANTARLLALVGEVYSYTGGAHGNSGFAVRIWDKTARQSVPVSALFSDWPRARKLIEPVYCAALAREQAERRVGQPVAAEFDACPKLSEQPIVPFGGLGRRAGQFRVLLGPYVAGPYVEGSYVVTAPWPEAVRSLVKPVYRSDLFGDGG